MQFPKLRKIIFIKDFSLVKKITAAWFTFCFQLWKYSEVESSYFHNNYNPMLLPEATEILCNGGILELWIILLKSSRFNIFPGKNRKFVSTFLFEDHINNMIYINNMILCDINYQKYYFHDNFLLFPNW